MSRAQRAVVAYPGVMPAAVQVARAFHEAGLLARYETTFVYEPDSALGRALHVGLGAVLGARAERELQRRALRGVPHALVQARPQWELLRTASSKLPRAEVLADRVWERTLRDFDRSVASRLRQDVGLVYGYEFACEASFERAKQLGIATVVDMAAAHHGFAEREVERERTRFPQLVTRHRRGTQHLDAEREARKEHERALADVIVANSRFTASTLIAAGYDAAKLAVVPLGAPPIDPRWRSEARSAELTFLFAGPIAVHKGAHLAIEAWRTLGAPRCALLLLAGQWALPDAWRRALPERVELLGSIPQPQLFEHYRRADALVFPSVCDGFAMVVAEALAHGLPVITTRNVGAADLIEPGVNGFVLEPHDVDALAERMQWCLEHRAELAAMREPAEATAQRHQWSDYRMALLAALRPLFRAA